MSFWVLGGGFVFVWAWVFLGGFMLLYGGIGPGVPHIMAIAAPGANNLDSGEAWVIRACMVRGGGGI